MVLEFAIEGQHVRLVELLDDLERRDLAVALAHDVLELDHEALAVAHDLQTRRRAFDALRRRYREGIPERSAAENESDAKVLYQFLRELGGEKLVGPGTELAPGTFWQGGKS